MQIVIASPNSDPQSSLGSAQDQLPAPPSVAIVNPAIASSNSLSDEKKHEILRMLGDADLLALGDSPMLREIESRPLFKSEKYEHGKRYR
jgi:hypothetical protein